MADLCKVDPGRLGAGERNQADEMGNYHPPSKGGGDYHGMGLLEPCWKVNEKIMVALLGRGTGTARIKAKLHQSLAWRDQCPLYQIYVYLK